MADTYQVKSDYSVLRRKARQSSKGDIYENNLMTITPFEVVMPEGQSIVYSDSNFKFSVRTDTNFKKKHSKNDWLRNASGKTEWTLDDVIDAPVSEESEVRIKPDYSSLRDFAYYGSAVEMVHATVNHVLMHFPGELYFSDDKFEPTNRQGEKINIGTYYIVYNECEINIETDFVDENTVENPYRYLCLTLQDYELLNNGVYVKSGLTRENFVRNPDFCDEGILGTVKIDGKQITVYVMAGRKFYLTKDKNNKGLSIRPNQDVITRYFETIDDFERVLLNRDSNPVYKAVFETTLEKEDGYYYTMEPYVWPSINNWTPDMHSSAYQSYIMRLISLAEYHDEFDSNNIWRMMTHEAIKNLDWTFFRENGDDVEDLSNIDSSRINAIIQLYGRQFDGLKRYIDNIKHSNKITYDQKNNVPDYLLTDAVENAGFDAILPINTATTSANVGESLFSGLSKIYNEVDANTNFMRNLKLNASYLNSVKGTREGVEAMLALLGFCPNEYEISEYVTVAKGNSEYCEMNSEDIFGISKEDADAERSSTCKYPAAIDVEMINTNKDSFPVNEFATAYQGIACKPIEVVDESGNTKYRYIVPWYENGKAYDGEWYFQCDGGWGKQLEIDVSGMTILGQPIGIDTLSGDTIFEETQSRLKFAENLQEMLDIYPNNLENGDICYVTDISDLKTLQDGIYSGINENVLSHYFIINDKMSYCILSGSGWHYIPMSEITSTNPSDVAKKVIYLETIKDNTTGNNPHVAKKEYDSGKRYVDCLNDIFKYSIETSGFSFFSDTDIENGIKTYNFNIESAYTIDNRKVEYFKREEPSRLSPSGNVEDFCPIYSGKTIIGTGYCINPEGGDKYLEPAANSIINLKNIKIKFSKPTTDESKLKEWLHYLKTVVFKYVEQMLPSTCILRWEIGDEIQPEPQPEPTLSVSPTSLEFASGSSSQIITVTTTNQSWTMENNDCFNWITLQKQGTNKIKVTVQSNTGNQRACSFKVKGTKNGEVTISVSQREKKPDAQIVSVNVVIMQTPVVAASGGMVTKDTTGVVYSAWTVYDDSSIGSVDNVTSNILTVPSKGTTASTETTAGTLTITAKTGDVTGTGSKEVLQAANVVTVTSGTVEESSLSGSTNEDITYEVYVQHPSINVSYESGEAQNVTIGTKKNVWNHTGWTITTATTTYTSAYTSGEKTVEVESGITVTSGVTSGITYENTGLTVSARESWQTVVTGTSGYIRYIENTSDIPRSGYTIYTINGRNESGMTTMVQEGKPLPPVRSVEIVPSSKWTFQVSNDEILQFDEVSFVLKGETTSGEINTTMRIETNGTLKVNETVDFTNYGNLRIDNATKDAFDVIVYVSEDSHAERALKIDNTNGWMNGMNFTMNKDGVIQQGTNYVTIHIPAGNDNLYTYTLNNTNYLAKIWLGNNPD